MDEIATGMRAGVVAKRGGISPAVQMGLWVGDWAICTWLTRAHHPTAAIDATATACLIAACASAVYVDGFILAPRLWRSGRRSAYALAVMATVLVAATVGVALIQGVYDVAWGPDPARYGLGFNLATDSLGVALHLAIAKGIAAWFGPRT